MRLPDTRILATVLLTSCSAVFMTLIVWGNVADYDTNKAFVVAVLEMRSTFQDPDLMWRAVDTPHVQTAFYIVIIALEAVAAAALWYAVFQLWTVRRAGDPSRSLRWVTQGNLLVIVVFGLGFTGIGGEYFAMWQSSEWNGLEPALRYYLFAVTGLIYATVALGQLREERSRT